MYNYKNLFYNLAKIAVYRLKKLTDVLYVEKFTLIFPHLMPKNLL